MILVWLRRLAPLVAAAALLTVALFVLHHQLAGFAYHDVAAYLRSIPRARFVTAAVLVVLDYLALTTLDAIAMRGVSRPLPYARTAFTSFIAFAFSQNIGHAALSGGAVRYRLYSAWGLAPGEIAQILLFSWLAYWLGFTAVAGGTLTFAPPLLPSPSWTPEVLRPIGVALLVIAAAALTAVLLCRRPLRVRAWALTPPRRRYVLALAVVGAADWLLVAGVAYLLLPAGGDVTFSAFVSRFLLAQVVGAVSQVPGGLGLFEASLLLLLDDLVPRPALIGAMLAYRVIYYLLPFAVAVVALSTFELTRHRRRVSAALSAFGRLAEPFVPRAATVLVFASGVVLLVSSATPAIPSRLQHLAQLVPLAVVEASHFFSSVAGAALLVLARGLQARLRAGFVAAIVVLLAGAVLSVLKGFDYEEALLLLATLAALLPLRAHFQRRSSFSAQRFTVHWTLAIVTTLLCVAWLSLFCFKHVEYSSQLWWRFAFASDAPRTLRAAVGVTVTLLVFSLVRLLRPAMPSAPPAGADELARAAPIVAACADTIANLALLGDKSLLFAPSGTAFVMYAIRGRSWIAMGDPVGPAAERAELAQAFRRLAVEHGGWPAFYQVRREDAMLYLDLGLALFKLGEEARVALTDFTIDRRRKDLRRAHRQAVQAGLAFAVAPAAEAPALMPALRAVSAAWLAAKRAREKRFSLGYFDPAYLARFPVAVARIGERIVGFANVWSGAGCELSVDLMRAAPDAPHGVMDFLLLELMAWGRARGYAWFNLGMAPLSGIRSDPQAPLWNRVAALAYHGGERFYNFRGLREYKEKFAPAWEPRYLACPGGLTAMNVLGDLTRLISG